MTCRMLWISVLTIILISCQNNKENEGLNRHEVRILKDDYANQLYGFWLGQCIANWTGLVTEMDKVGDVGEVKTGKFYTRDNWGKADKPNIWSGDKVSDISSTIDYVLRDTSEIWGADDDTDIEYMYQYLLHSHQTSLLSPEQIQQGWLRHIRHEEENYLWVSNEAAFELMKEGVLPPQTGDPAKNPKYEMIDAQLTTEIFGLFAPGRPDIARRVAELPIQTVARHEAEDISQFYVTMYSLAAVPTNETIGERIYEMADSARSILPDDEYPALMYDFVKRLYKSNIPWEAARDSIYERYQVQGEDGYEFPTDDPFFQYCGGCFAAGINYAASLVSLFYGEGDIKETIKIGTLCGWDSDNPTATWGGLFGFMLGREGVQKAFGSNLSNRFHIHRTRQNFPNDGMDTFENMAQVGVEVTEQIVLELMGGKVDTVNNAWVIP